MEALIESLKQVAREFRKCDGEQLATELEAFLRKKAAEYSVKLGYTELQVLEAIESKRTYSAVNYYQEANFPSLDDVVIFDNLAAFMEKYPSGKYRCPACEGVSTSPYDCNSNLPKKSSGKGGKEKEICKWKSYGLFGTLDKGMRVTFKDQFLSTPKIDNIFMPIEALQ